MTISNDDNSKINDLMRRVRTIYNASGTPADAFEILEPRGFSKDQIFLAWKAAELVMKPVDVDAIIAENRERTRLQRLKDAKGVWETLSPEQQLTFFALESQEAALFPGREKP
jgi:hypothetical protein